MTRTQRAYSSTVRLTTSGLERLRITWSSFCGAPVEALQQHWAQAMPEPMANVAGVLELSIALGNLQPDYSLV